MHYPENLLDSNLILTWAFFKLQETEDECIRRRKMLYSKNDTKAEIVRICAKFRACNEKKYDDMEFTVYDALNDGCKDSHH